MGSRHFVPYSSPPVIAPSWGVIFTRRFYFNLYDDKRLKGLKQSEKMEIVNSAVKQFREDKPINISRRLLIMFLWCGIPALVFLILFNFGFAIGWFALSILILGIKNANDESAEIAPYLDKVLE